MSEVKAKFFFNSEDLTIRGILDREKAYLGRALREYQEYGAQPPLEIVNQFSRIESIRQNLRALGPAGEAAAKDAYYLALWGQRIYFELKDLLRDKQAKEKRRANVREHHERPTMEDIAEARRVLRKDGRSDSEKEIAKYLGYCPRTIQAVTGRKPRRYARRVPRETT